MSAWPARGVRTMSESSLPATEARGLARWWIYQRERFPLFAHGALVLAFSGCAVSLSAHLRDGSWPSISALTVAFISCLLFFAQLRIADEFKDYDEDCAYRPYRPVPRGLVSLNELAVVFAGAAGIQLWLAWQGSVVQLVLLVVTWLYLTGMCVEFGCRQWLKARPVTYLWSHMLIMPLVDLYATACDWAQTDTTPPVGLVPFLIASLANGFVLELGRKIRRPEDEEHGVETYSVLWGPPRAVAWWLGAIAACFACALICAAFAGALLPVAAVLTLALVYCAWVARRFLTSLPALSGKTIEHASAFWTLALYLSLGLLPQWLA